MVGRARQSLSQSSEPIVRCMYDECYVMTTNTNNFYCSYQYAWHASMTTNKRPHFFPLNLFRAMRDDDDEIAIACRISE